MRSLFGIFSGLALFDKKEKHILKTVFEYCVAEGKRIVRTTCLPDRF